MVPPFFRVTRGICPHYFLRGNLQGSIIWGKSVWWRHAPTFLLRSALWRRAPFWNRSKPRAPSGYRAFWTTAALCVAPRECSLTCCERRQAGLLGGLALSPLDFLPGEWLRGALTSKIKTKKYIKAVLTNSNRIEYNKVIYHSRIFLITQPRIQSTRGKKSKPYGENC